MNSVRANSHVQSRTFSVHRQNSHCDQGNATSLQQLFLVVSKILSDFERFSLHEQLPNHDHKFSEKERTTTVESVIINGWSRFWTTRQLLTNN